MTQAPAFCPQSTEKFDARQAPGLPRSHLLELRNAASDLGGAQGFEIGAGSCELEGLSDGHEASPGCVSFWFPFCRVQVASLYGLQDPNVTHKETNCAGDNAMTSGCDMSW